MGDEQTIAACATAVGESAIAVVRLSGAQSLAVAMACMDLARPPKPRQVTYSRFLDARGQVLDDVLWWHASGPGTYTGEDTVEISFHGSPFIVKQGLARLHETGARPAEPGEFTRRAFLNGKLDLAQAEAVIDLIQSRAAQAHHFARQRLDGEGGNALRSLYDRWQNLAALFEAYLNFPDDVMDEMDDAEVSKAIQLLQNEMKAFNERLADRRPLYDGVRVLLAGAPNVGKSSLFNRLVGFERAIVSPTPGTTRDYLEAELTLGGLRFRLFDQAGWREGAEEIERQGIVLGRKLAETADIIVFLIDLSRELTAEEENLIASIPKKPLILVGSKLDTTTASQRRCKLAPDVLLSCNSGEGIPVLEERLVALGSGIANPHGEQTLHYGQQHRAALKEAEEALAKVAQAHENGLSLEFLAIDVREGASALGSLLGVTLAEDALDRVFSQFCIGK